MKDKYVMYKNELEVVFYTEIRRRFPKGAIPLFEISLYPNNNSIQISFLKKEASANFVKTMKKQKLLLVEDNFYYYLDCSRVMRLFYSNYMVTDYGIIFDDVSSEGVLQFTLCDSTSPKSTFVVNAGSYLHAHVRTGFCRESHKIPMHRIELYSENIV